MKILKVLHPVLAAGIIFSILTVSCGNSKKTAVPCPDFSKSRSYRTGENSSGKNLMVHYARREAVKNTRPAYQHAENATGNRRLLSSGLPALQFVPEHNSTSPGFGLIHAKQGEIQEVANDIRVFQVNFSVPPVINARRHSQYAEKKLVARDSSMVCDTIVFKAGNILLAKVTEIGLNEIKYRECENLSGPLIAILKSDVFVIKYPNGTRDYFDQIAPVIRSETANAEVPQPAGQKVAGIAIAGFVASLLGLLVAGLPLGIFAIIAGAIGLGKIERNPGRYKGKGFATASLIIGLVDVVGVLLYLISL